MDGIDFGRLPGGFLHSATVMAMEEMSKINVIAAGIEVALDKGLKPDECYAILKNSGYSDEELHQAFLKVAAIDRSKSTKTGLE